MSATASDGPSFYENQAKRPYSRMVPAAPTRPECSTKSTRRTMARPSATTSSCRMAPPWRLSEDGLREVHKENLARPPVNLDLEIRRLQITHRPAVCIEDRGIDAKDRRARAIQRRHRRRCLLLLEHHLTTRKGSGR